MSTGCAKNKYQTGLSINIKHKQIILPEVVVVVVL